MTSAPPGPAPSAGLGVAPELGVHPFQAAPLEVGIERNQE